MSLFALDYRTGYAVVAIVASVFALSLGDALIKATGVSLPLWQMYILRSALVLPMVWFLARRNGPLALKAPLWVVLRSALLVVMWLSYYASLPLMPLSLAAAAYYTGPLFIIALASAHERKWPNGRALLAIALGFLGVVLVIRPDTSGFRLVTLLPVFAAFLYACAMVLTAARCRDDNPFMLAFALNVAFIVAGLFLGLFSGQEKSFIFGAWQSVDLRLAGILVALAALVMIGSVGAAIAYQNGPPSTIAAFDYLYLVFSLMWGGLFFGELPGALSLLGIAIVFGAGLLAVMRRS